MKIHLYILATLLLSACSQAVEPIEAEPAEISENSVEETTLEEIEVESTTRSIDPASHEGYEIVAEPFEDSYKSYLLYGDTQIAELPYNPTGWNEYLLYNVFREEDRDTVFVVSGAGCGGCVAFLDHYYVIHYADFTIETVEFSAPPDLTLEEMTPVMTVFSDEDEDTNEMAYVQRHGVFGDTSYYEEVWTYLFGKREWVLVETLPAQETVLCVSMGESPDPKKLHFWKGAMMIRSEAISGDMFCEY